MTILIKVNLTPYQPIPANEQFINFNQRVNNCQCFSNSVSIIIYLLLADVIISGPNDKPCEVFPIVFLVFVNKTVVPKFIATNKLEPFFEINFNPVCIYLSI